MKWMCLTGSRRISRKIGWINIVVALLAAQAAADSAFFSVPLQRTGVDANAGGLVTITLAQNTSSLVLQASNLAPSRVCTVLVAGIARGTFVPNRAGRGQLTLSVPSAPGTNILNFDPRGKQLSVVQNGAVVLHARISGPGEPPGSIVDERVTVPRVPGGGGGRADASYQLTNGTRQFSVTLTNVPDGASTLYIDGIRRRNFAVRGGAASITFDNAPLTAAPALNFDPRGLVLDIARGTNLAFSGKFAARANGINVAKPSLVTRFIPATATTTVGFARVRRWIERDARRKVDVELVDVPAGDYDLIINQAFRGVITVVTTATGAEGEMQFASEPDDEDEHPLDFNPLTTFYIVQSGNVSTFEGQPVIGDTNAPAFTPARFEVPLFNLDADKDATARVQYKRDENNSRHFEVVVKNVPAGNYVLTLNGITAGFIPVSTTSSGTRGIIEFEDAPELAENLLTFDPLGQTIGIERSGVHYFQRTLPANP